MLVKKSSPLAPFPLLDPLRLSLEWEKEHSAEIDAWFGIQTAQIEANLAGRKQIFPGQETWIGFDPQVFQTPYTELRWMLDHLSRSPVPVTQIVDLGAGYGRLAMVLAESYPHIPFLGFELVAERVRASQHLKTVWTESRKLLTQDITHPDFQLPSASHYFIYDFGSQQAVDAVLEKLRNQAKSASFCLIGRGRRVRDRIQAHHPWISGEKEPEHHSRLSFYGSF